MNGWHVFSFLCIGCAIGFSVILLDTVLNAPPSNLKLFLGAGLLTIMGAASALEGGKKE
jgi:hypothetical protein